MSAPPSDYVDSTENAAGRATVAFISDDGYALPTAVAIRSLISSRRSTTHYQIYVVASSMSDANIRMLEGLSTGGANVRIVTASAEHLRDLHIFDSTSIAAATIDALLKFFLPDLLPDEDRVLYLDGDILVMDDLADLFATDLDGSLVAAAPDSGAIYYRHDYVKQVQLYFNSGVMVMDLDAWRREGLTQRLVSRKRELNDSSLVDQNVLNLEFDGQVRFLPPRFNVLWVNLLRAARSGAVTIEQLNDHFETDYESFDSLLEDAAIIHFSSKDKPWVFSDTPGADLWYRQFLEAGLPRPISRTTRAFSRGAENSESPARISVILPFYQSAKYLQQAIYSALCQDLAEIELICVDDGSTDEGSDIVRELALRDARVKLLRQENGGAGAARNLALREAVGEYVLFLDSDDWLQPNSLAELYAIAGERQLDVLLFEGESEYETPDLARSHPGYRTYYQYRGEYDTVQAGAELFVAMTYAWDMKDSAAMRMIRRSMLVDHGIAFPEGIVREDCYFAFISLVAAERASVLHRSIYVRRVRDGSVMTAARAADHYRGLITVVNLVLERLLDMPTAETIFGAGAIRVESYLKSARRLLESMPSDEAAALEAQRHVDLPNVVALAHRAGVTLKPRAETQRLRRQNARLRERLATAKSDLERVKGKYFQLRSDLISQRKANARLTQQLAATRGSMSYRIGNAIVRPVAVVRSLLPSAKTSTGGARGAGADHERTWSESS